MVDPGANEVFETSLKPRTTYWNIWVYSSRSYLPISDRSCRHPSQHLAVSLQLRFREVLRAFEVRVLIHYNVGYLLFRLNSSANTASACLTCSGVGLSLILDHP